MALSPYKQYYNPSSGMLYGYYGIEKPLTAGDLKQWTVFHVDWHMFFDEKRKGTTTYRKLDDGTYECSGTYQRTIDLPAKEVLNQLNDWIKHNNINNKKIESIYGTKWVNVEEAEIKKLEGHKTCVPKVNFRAML